MDIAALTRLRFISYIEGLSFLVLLLIAMPLKYGFDLPEAVRFAGMLHGVLFVLFALALLDVLRQGLVELRDAIVIGALSMVPLGFLPIDRSIARRRLALQRR